MPTAGFEKVDRKWLLPVPVLTRRPPKNYPTPRPVTLEDTLPTFAVSRSSRNVLGQGRCAVLSRSVPCTAGLWRIVIDNYHFFDNGSIGTGNSVLNCCGDKLWNTRSAKVDEHLLGADTLCIGLKELLDAVP